MQNLSQGNPDQITFFGEGKKYLITTLGCQMNEHDSEIISAMLENLGYDPAESQEEADLIIINTCAVRKKPEDKVASMLGKYCSLKNQNEDLIIAVGGCMTQQEEVAAYIKKRFSRVDLVFGTHALPRLPYLLDQARRNKETIVDIEEDYGSREGLPKKPFSSFHAWVPIIYGCNNFCSYCVVPYVRGRERSRKFSDIISEVRSLAHCGYWEITLLGQNVNSYGQDLRNGLSFAKLLNELNYIEELKRIRFMTSHPKDLSGELIEAVKQGEKICEHFHLPVQAGSNRILEKMNRHYTREQYRKLVEDIKSAIPGVSITSDIIVGFPGETGEDFAETVDLIKKVRFDSAFAFIYSPRKRTRAARMEDNVSYEEKEKRLQQLNQVQQRISKEENERLVDQILEVMVEGPSKNNPEMQTGRARTNKLIHFYGASALTGKLAKVKITEARTWNLFGELNEVVD
ncbi:MAG: tRNA (N6-isopentenyl adenosine(37)-C2)-methylthiotransferase MiaB [Bacillota bacterium]